MSIKTIHDTADKTWFITFTCFSWVPLFQITNSYDLVYNWLSLIKEKYSIDTSAFVIMPNHVHAIIHLNTSSNLNKVISNGKRFMAYEMVKRLKVQNREDVLTKLSDACSVDDKKNGQLHRVFEPSFDAKSVLTDKFLQQKLEYIHHNPTSGKWSLAETFIDYEHSSAGFYERNLPHSNVSLKHYLDLEG
ncbi:transposase [Pedobacter arcticus]|uniref:transposase n=1 Tax=Pedobacter arcticus TaxID=752140 RepID=UPI0002E2FA07|nr:transposase [Pedobacter arcticus]